MDEKFFDKYKGTKNLAMAMAVYSSTSILGPLIIIGGAGYLLDRVFNTRPFILIISIIIAFIVTNILLFKKVVALTKWISKQKDVNRQKDKDNANNVN